MIIAIASGKGGTGKTTLAVNLAKSIENVSLHDCDVEEPNVHLFLKPTITKTETISVFNPLIDDEKCTRCGKCVEVCEFNALAMVPNTILFFPDLCLSCEACMDMCPENAISRQDKIVGEIHLGKTDEGIKFADGLLDIGVPRAIPIIEAVKDEIDETRITILDAPPGNSCPVIETIVDSDYCILVTEPTPFGLFDLSIAVEVVQQLQIPFGIVINRYYEDENNLIEDYCEKENLDILMKIPFKREIAEAYAIGKIMIDILPEWKVKFQELYTQIEEKVEKK
ncbi:MAG: nucleotide-binding protein [Candidatus Heimdallarchaeota archaeon]